MEKVERNLKKDKQKPPIFLLILLIFILLVLYVVYQIGLNFEPVAVIEYEGHAISGKNLVENLLRSDLNAEEYIEPIKVEEDSVIYKKVASYFVGEEKKTKINLDYPIYINGNIALLNMTDDIKLLTTDLDVFDGYKDSALTDGGLYNIMSFDRADYNDYLFIKNSDNVYISSKEIIIKTIANTYIIPANSIINFTEEYITYYHMEDNIFKYKSIIDISNDSEVITQKIENTFDFENGKVETESKTIEYSYKDFLIKLKIIREDKKQDKNEDEDENKVQQDNQQEENEQGDNIEDVNQGENNGEQEIIWQKPVVTATDFVANVYTASTNLYIYDPSRTIKTAIIFEIYKDGKVYMRNQSLSSGNLKIGILEPDTEYEIKGKYQYLTKEKKTIEVQFLNQKIKTKDTSGLKPLKLYFENKNIYSNKIELSNLKLDCNLNETSETIAGVRKAELIINGEKQEIKSYDLRRILSGQTIDLQSKANLKSNSKYKFEIKFYDVSNNLIQVYNNTGETNTCMQKPEIKISKKNNKNTIEVPLELKYINPDNVTIKNQKYVVYSTSNEVIDQGEVTEDIIIPKNLEFSKYYTIKIYGDFDLNDNKGEIKGDILGEFGFSTASLESFGNLYVDLNVKNVTESNVTLDFNINTTTNRTNIELLGMLQDAEIILLKDGETYIQKKLTEEEFLKFKNLENINLEIEGLESNTNYELQIKSLVSFEKRKEIFTAIINGDKEFDTLKKEAILNIKNLFILNDAIDFDINIYDKDGAIRDSVVTLEVISTKDEIVYRNDIQSSTNYQEYTRIQINDLIENEKYYLSLKTNKYSVRHEIATVSKKVFEFNGIDERIEDGEREGEKVGIISTNTVGGDITLQSIERTNTDITGNLVDVQSNVNWYSECFNTDKGYLKEFDQETKILKLGVGGNTSQYYLYDLLSSYKEYNEEELEVSFKYKISNNSLKIYLQNGIDKNIIEINNSNTTENDGWNVFNSKEISNTINTNKYIGISLNGPIDSYIEIKELQVKLKTQDEDEIVDAENQEEYLEYKYKVSSKFVMNLNLHDEKLTDLGYEPNVTNGIYYIRIKNNTDNEIIDKKYDDYIKEASNDNGKEKNTIEEHLKELELLENKQYEIMLIIKHPNVQNREYILSSIEVDTSNKEIKNIFNEEEYLKIQPNGSYIVTDKNLNLGSGDYRFGNENLKFNGFIDFNGKKVTREMVWKDEEEDPNYKNYKYYLFYGFSEKAIIKNLYFNFFINLRAKDGNPNVVISEKNSGLVYINEGKISNIIVDLKFATKSPNKQFAIIGYENKGTLENFVIYLGSDFYLGGEGALGFVYCTKGIMKNGYITPYPAKGTIKDCSIKPINCQAPSSIDRVVNIGGLAAYVSVNSEISNIYSLVNINEDEDSENDKGTPIYAGNLVSETTNSTVKNVYSVGIGNVTLGNSSNGFIGPTIAYPYNSENGNNVENSYFCYEEDANNNEYNTKVNIAALRNKEFQEKLLNSVESDNAFIINSNIRYYFPKIKLPEVMPIQKNIPMKTTNETDADILLVDLIEDEDIEKLVEITVYNPREAKIDKIEIQGLEVDKYRIHMDKYCINDSPAEKCTGSDEEGYCLDKNGNRILVEQDGYTQNYEMGQTTKLVTKIRIPTEKNVDENGFDSREYKSKYNLKSIRAKGYAEKNYFNDDGTIKIVNELALNYYYQIKSLDDWKRINVYIDQNYRIISDLDFTEKIYSDYCITKTFKGMIDGKYKKEDGTTEIAKLKNIGQEDKKINATLIYKLEGAKLSNLMIDGYDQIINKKTIANDTYYRSGLIGTVENGTIIENVHMSNVSITTDIVKGDFHIGGLASNAKNSIIRNSSVSYKVSYKNDELQPNVKDKESRTVSSATVGGLIGSVEGTKISNCFVNDLYMNLRASASNGIGGVVGECYIVEIYNCYSIGQIKTNRSKVGGIFGESRVDMSELYKNVFDNCYTMVNIKTESVQLGGIGGSIDRKSTVENNISLGNLYTSTTGNMQLNRIIGLGTGQTNNNNYGYTNQLINGFKTTSLLGAKDIYTEETFRNNNIFDEKVYNVEDLKSQEKTYLPRLKYENSDKLLPNQKMKTFPQNPTLEIISAKKNSQGNVEVKILDENEVPVSTNNISIRIDNFANTETIGTNYSPREKTHTITVRGTPIYYLDSYEINRITYKDNNGEEYSAEVAVKIDYTQYKEISSLQDWASEFCPTYSKYRYSTTEGDGKTKYLAYQNYKILGNLNLLEIKNLDGENLDIPVNLEIGRLIGSDNKPIISLGEGQTLTFNGNRSGIFSNISKEFKNLAFENITIKNNSGSYTGIVANCESQAELRNLSFSNINISATGDYVGIIGKSQAPNINGITLNNIDCTGRTNVGAFIGQAVSGKINTEPGHKITGDNIRVTGSGNNIGGIIGNVYYSSSYGNSINNINVSNVYIKHTGAGSYICGLFGTFQCNNGSNYTIKNLKIECTSGKSNSRVAGVAGYIRSTIKNISIYGININVTGSSSYIGGIIGDGGKVVDAYLEGHTENGEIYNTINAPNSWAVSGSNAYTWSGASRVLVKNMNIIGNDRVGGIVGFTVTGTTVEDAVCQDCTVTGNTRVGGIVGSLEKYNTVATNSLHLRYSYTNAKVTANRENAGGLIGYIDNSKMNNKTHISKIYNNYVACSEITSPKNAGGMIGKITNSIYYLNDANKYYYGNLVVSNVSEDYPIGNIDQTFTEIVKEYEEDEDGEIIEIPVEIRIEKDETRRRLFNSLFYQYQVDENGDKVLEKSKLDNIKQKNTYTSTLLFGTSKYNYSNVDTMFPVLTSLVDKTVTFSDGTIHQFIENGINLPKETEDILLTSEIATFSLKNYLKEELPQYEVYTSGVNKINVEFKEVNNNAYFKYEDSKGNVSKEITIDKKTYSFEYDFTSDFKITIGNSKNTQERIIKPEDIKKKVSISNGNYYYLNENTLKVSTDTIEGKFANLFEGEALTVDGYVYDLTNDTIGKEKTVGLQLLDNSIPIAKNVYSGSIIETYYNYSNIINTEESNVDYQIFMKNGNMFVLDGDLDIYADSIIIDAYNNKEYQTVLGKDGKIYDLKEQIKYPDNFKNEEIIQMTNNICKEQNQILIMYKNGRTYVFNYITGSVLFDSNNQEENSSLMSNINSLFEGENILYELNKEDYEKALLLQEKLVETPIEVAQQLIKEQQKVEVNSNETKYNVNSVDTTQENTGDYNTDENVIANNTITNTTQNDSQGVNNNNTYTTVYDANTKQYLVYKISELVDTNNEKEEVVSETEKINSTPGLKEYYNSAQINKSYNKTNGIYFVIVTIMSILVILVVMYKKKNYE